MSAFNSLSIAFVLCYVSFFLSFFFISFHLISIIDTSYLHVGLSSVFLGKRGGGLHHSPVVYSSFFPLRNLCRRKCVLYDNEWHVSLLLNYVHEAKLDLKKILLARSRIVF